MTNIQKSLEKETNLSLLLDKSGNGLINKLKVSKNTITDLNLAQDGDSTFSSRTTHSSSSSHWQQSETSSWTEQYFSSLFRDVITLAGNLISWQSTGGVDRHTYRTPHVLMHSFCAISLQSCCQSVQSHIDLHAPAWLESRSACVSPQNTSSSAHHVLHRAEPDNTHTHEHSFLASSRTSILNNPAKINGHSTVAT